jgi:hypothetical protein
MLLIDFDATLWFNPPPYSYVTVNVVFEGATPNVFDFKRLFGSREYLVTADLPKSGSAILDGSRAVFTFWELSPPPNVNVEARDESDVETVNLRGAGINARFSSKTQYSSAYGSLYVGIPKC